MATIMVTGATGKLGNAVLAHLLKSGSEHRLLALVRDPSRATALEASGVVLRIGDYEDPASLERAFAGVDRLLLISSGGAELLELHAQSVHAETAVRIRQHGNVLQAARSAGVGFVAYTSAPKADTSTMEVAEVHALSERLVRESGIAFAILRNNWYAENALEEIAVIPQAVQHGEIVSAAGDGRIGWVLRDELGEAAARVLEAAPRHVNVTYELSGPAVTFEEFAAALTSVLKRPITVRHVDDEAYGAAIAPLVQPPLTTVRAEVVFQKDVRAGMLDIAHSDLELALGHRPRTLIDTLQVLVLRASTGPGVDHASVRAVP